MELLKNLKPIIQIIQSTQRKNNNIIKWKNIYDSTFFHTNSIVHGNIGKDNNIKTKTMVDIVFKDNKTGESKKVMTPTGLSLLEVAHRNNIDLEGACEGSMACSTCHVILEDKLFNTLEEACEEEDDMLDLAYGLTSTSRLGCQVIVTEDFNKTTVTLPSATRNFYVDGHVPKPH